MLDRSILCRNMSNEPVPSTVLPQPNAQPQTSRILLNVEDYHQAAKEKLPKMAYDYYRSGADDELTLQENVNAYRRIKLRPRMFVDVSHHSNNPDSCSVTLLNGQTKCSYPVLIAPTAMHRIADDDGERSTARAAVRANTVMILSTLSTTRIEDVAQEHQQALKEFPNSTSQLWFQLYILKDRPFTAKLVQRAEQAGCRALVLTVDACRFGNREADHRNGFRLPDHMQLENLRDAGLKQAQNEHVSALNDFIAKNLDASLTWKDIQWLRQISRLPVIVKGIMTGEDAQLAVRAGVDGIVVSNHGARQVDTTLEHHRSVARSSSCCSSDANWEESGYLHWWRDPTWDGYSQSNRSGSRCSARRSSCSLGSCRGRMPGSGGCTRSAPSRIETCYHALWLCLTTEQPRW